MHLHDLPPELTDRKFEIAVRRLADDLSYGYDTSPYLGAGTDYVQSRPFVEGDSVHDLDWKVTARMGRFYVKQYEALKTTPIYLVLDTSASMSFSSRPISKYLLALLVAGGLGLAALRRLSPVGLLAAGERQVHFEPSLSMGPIFQWLHALRQRRFDERTHLADRIDELGGWLRSRSLVIVLSDLHDDLHDDLHGGAAVPAIQRLAQRHDCVVLQLEDPAERGAIRGGVFVAQEAETGRVFVAHGRSRWFEGRVKPSEVFRRSGIDYLLLATDRPFVALLRRFLADRGSLLRNTR